MANHIVEVCEIRVLGRGERIGFGYFNDTVNCFIRPFAKSKGEKLGIAWEVFSAEQYVVIVETIYTIENWGDIDHKIDSDQFDKFLRFAEARVLEKKGVKLDLSGWDDATIAFFKDNEALAAFITKAYEKWKEQGNSLASPFYK